MSIKSTTSIVTRLVWIVLGATAALLITTPSVWATVNDADSVDHDIRGGIDHDPDHGTDRATDGVTDNGRDVPHATRQRTNEVSANEQRTTDTQPGESVVDSHTDSAVASDDVAVPSQPPSNAARTRLDRARNSVVQIRGFFGDSQSDAFHGSGFAATADGLIVTNYHVVSDAVLYPKQYRLEYLTTDGHSGKLRVYGIDVEHDLAVVKSDDLALPPLHLRTQIPNKGERAYSIGFPLNLGLTITEGVANGLVENTLEQRIYYSGAINAGMSGGPALDANGAVYGVNVSVITAKQLVSFVVPAKHIAPLLQHAKAPLDPKVSRQLVAEQLFAHQASLLAPLLSAAPTQMATQSTAGFALPAKIAPTIECNSDGSVDSGQPLRVESIGCATRVTVFVQRGLELGDIRFQHRVLVTNRLHALQFAKKVNVYARSGFWFGSGLHVAPFACDNDIVALDGFDARVSICVREYRLFAGLYDVAVNVVSLNSSQLAVVSNLALRGVAFDSGMQFVNRYLRTLRWTR